MTQREMLKRSHASPLGYVLCFLGVFRLRQDGTAYTPCYRFYHPITWVLCLIVFVVKGALEGARAVRYEFGS